MMVMMMTPPKAEDSIQINNIVPFCVLLLHDLVRQILNASCGGAVF
jgi:hypothetical protein